MPLTWLDAEEGPLTPTAARPPAVRAGVEDNRHSVVEHHDAWVHRYLDELDRAFATAVREMSTGAGGAATKGAPALGCPLVWGVWLPVRDVGLRPKKRAAPMNKQDRVLHQVHWAKLGADGVASIVSLVLLWNGYRSATLPGTCAPLGAVTVTARRGLRA